MQRSRKKLVTTTSHLARDLEFVDPRYFMINYWSRAKFKVPTAMNDANICKETQCHKVKFPYNFPVYCLKQVSTLPSLNYCTNTDSEFLWLINALQLDIDINFSSLFYSIIGTPSQSDWPSTVSLARSSFQRYVSFSLAELIPEMCSSGTNLLKVLN